MYGQKSKICTKLSSTFLRKWWIILTLALILLLLGILVICGYSALIKEIIDYQVALRPSSQTYEWWSRPPVKPKISIYIYNVTNADEFLNNGLKPVLHELGPYVYTETWEKVNIVENLNGTLSYNLKKTFLFQEELSIGSEEDIVIVPNIPMLSATSQSKHAARFLRLAMASIMDILKIKPFVEVSIGQLLWGYEDPLLKLAKDVVPKEQKLPYEEFGLMYGKNATSTDRITIFTGVSDIRKYGIIDKFNGKSQLSYWFSDDCNRLNGTDGSIFPPHIDYNRTIHIYDKDLCRLLPLTFEKEIETESGVKGFRFTPPKSVFANSSSNPENKCFCPGGRSECSPNGLFNVSLCQYDSPIFLSFPHFYLSDDELRNAVEGISEPDKKKHEFYIDVQPNMGTTLRARARIQINLAVSQVVDIKQVANFPDIVFPILWFEEGIDDLPAEITDLIKVATTAPPKARAILTTLFFASGFVLLMVSTFCLIRSSHRQSTLHLEGSNYLATAQIDLSKNTKEENSIAT